MLMRSLIASIFMLALAAPLAACTDDAKPCVGHLCGTDIKLTDPDGGNILFEYIYFDSELAAAFKLPAGITTAHRAMAYFLNSQTPNNNLLPTPGVCNNFDATMGWPMFQGTAHEDLDVGTLTITGKNTAGEDKSIPLAKTDNGTGLSADSIGRKHNLFYQTILPKAEDYVAPNSFYTINFGGSASVPATTFKDQLFMAQGFTVNNPGLEENGPLKASTDFTVHWTPAESSNAPTGTDVLGITWLVDSNGSPTHMCPVLESAGQFTIPAATIAEYRQVAMARGTNPDKVILLRNAVVHRVARLPNGDKKNQRRIDTLTVHCWAQLMDCTAN